MGSLIKNTCILAFSWYIFYNSMLIIPVTNDRLSRTTACHERQPVQSDHIIQWPFFSGFTLPNHMQVFCVVHKNDVCNLLHWSHDALSESVNWVDIGLDDGSPPTALLSKSMLADLINFLNILRCFMQLYIPVFTCLISPLPRNYCHFDEIFITGCTGSWKLITGCTGSCQNDNFQCSQW